LQLGRRAFTVAAATAALTLARTRVVAQTGQRVLRVVPQAEPQSFDPVFTQVNNVSMHGAMIYDQLFGWESRRWSMTGRSRTTGCSTPSRCGAD
jgi:hypothetical protein